MQNPMPGRPWQVRQTALEIDLGHLKRNYHRLLARARGAELLALMKSDAYGHSLRDVSAALERLPASSRLHGYGVANVEEGIELRRAGVRRPIYVLSGIQKYDQDLHRCLGTVGLTPVVSSIEVLRLMVKTLDRVPGKRSLHLKFNTGMNRLGIESGEVEECLQLLSSCRSLEVQGLMSHFAAADKPECLLSKRQVREFRKIVARFAESGLKPRHIHMANSEGLASRLFPEGNLARVGLHLYGLDDPALKPVARWTAQVYQVRELKKGQSVGYGPHFRAHKNMRMAVLGVGYGDGYRRAYSNKAEVLVRGKRCKVIGAVSMDLTTIDVTPVPSVTSGERAVLLGQDRRDRITAAELARHSQSISWEVLTGISSRVPRVFVNG